MVQVTARQHGRPFNNVLELLPNSDDESTDEQDTKRSPEEQLLRDLVNLAMTIRDDGQVNPLTVVDVSEGVMRQSRTTSTDRHWNLICVASENTPSQFLQQWAVLIKDISTTTKHSCDYQMKRWNWLTDMILTRKNFAT